MPSVCSFTMTCPSDMSAALDSTHSIAGTIGIIVGTAIGLAFSLCIIIMTYLLFCKRTKSQTQMHEQSVSMFPYTYSSQTPMQQVETDLQKPTEDEPPAYEEINTLERTPTQIV
ncbi:hypothetical protein I4U23_006936 [Adineta vaga]|nr:hypothetical protein I4U23_006936 [Adineta vaga]